MPANLDALKDEILAYLEAEGFLVYRGYTRQAEDEVFIYWDTRGFPDFRLFLRVAREVGARLVVFSFRTFSEDMVESALGRLEDCELSREDRRSIERRLRDLRAYDGFTCALELSFDYQSRAYLFSLEADWYEDYLDLLDEIEAATPEGEEEEDEGSMGGYFSRN